MISVAMFAYTFSSSNVTRSCCACRVFSSLSSSFLFSPDASISFSPTVFGQFMLYSMVLGLRASVVGSNGNTPARQSLLSNWIASHFWDVSHRHGS